MGKKEFLKTLRMKLRKYREINIEEVIFYYNEIIQDAIDEGENEELFIKNLGSIKDIVVNITEDDEFITEVKNSNHYLLTSVMNSTVKIITYFFYLIAIFTLSVISFSVIMAGGAIALQSLAYIDARPLLTSDYFVIAALIALGVGIILLGLSIIQQIMRMSYSFRLFLARKIKTIFRNKEVKNHE